MGALAGLLLCLGISQAGAADAAYAGTDTCKGCHEELAAAFGKSFHGQAWVSSGKYQVSGCEACHGPGSKHAADPSKASIVSFGKGSAQTAEQRTAACLSCHVTSKELDFWGVGKHASNGVACADCHDIHAGAVPKVKQPDVCFDCHKDIRLDANKQSHHPIIEGKVSCNDCHNPHGSMAHGMVRADSRNQLCYRCHAEKRGPFAYEHPPVEENCGTCHESHGSRHDKLLTQRMPNLCQDCHGIDGSHPTRAYTENFGFNGTESASNKSRFTARACMNCHNMIHGSSGSAAFIR
jgi:DmsE family decaheme c-type cytochrome